MKIIFCLPGNKFSNMFLLSWTSTLGTLQKKGIEVTVANEYTSNVYQVRNLCLGGKTCKGINQKPWNNEIDYDYIMWIDSDIIWSVKQILTLINIAEKHKNDIHILSGLYLMDDKKHYATVKNWDVNYFKKHNTFQFLSISDILEDHLFDVAYTGMGFMLVRKGVFESMEYPWFCPKYEKMILDNGIVVNEFTSEDVGFCRKATEKGYKIFINPSVIVGHEKLKII